jgi:feruloyl esterase
MQKVMVALVVFVPALLAATFQAAPCESLTSVSIENGTIVKAEVVPEGPFVRPDAPAGDGRNSAAEPIPAHCRVTMVLTPTFDSHIGVELWLPSEDWNGRLLAVGNGWFAGSIQGYGDMQVALRRGYATVATDTGHAAADGPGAMFGLAHPEKIIDFAYRAVHDMTVKSKRIIDAFYNEPLSYSYFKGCSTGGRQAVMAAQRFPGDFDGIIAGAMANRHIHMHTARVARGIRVARNPDETISAEQAQMVTEAVMSKCDTLGEGFLNNPRQCTFDVSSLLCGGATTSGGASSGSDGATDGGITVGANGATDGSATSNNRSASGGQCLTKAQLRTVETWYGGVKNSKGEMIFSGKAFGNPMGEVLAFGVSDAPYFEAVYDTVRIWGFQDAEYNLHDFDLDRDMPIIDRATGLVDADNPDLRGFKAHGGKLLLYHGWSDPNITPENTVHYYESVMEEMGDDQADWMRLFMVPGMGHCGGGPGVNTFDSITAIQQWREGGTAPDQIMGSNPTTGLTRPLCPNPQYARYDGSGSLADASNWSCAPP